MSDSSAQMQPVAHQPVSSLDTLAPSDVTRQVELIQQVMKEVMKEGMHYGKIPGCGDKPSLYQPGAQVLGLTFRLTPRFSITERDLPGGHREYKTDVEIVHIPTQQVVGTGVGVCSTMESKYRWRRQFNETEAGEVPRSYWDIDRDNKQARHAELVTTFGPGRYRTKRTDDGWKVFRIEGDDQRVENPDIADVYNTVLKISAKRGYVHGILNATAASDMFTQDLEDLADEETSTAAAPAAAAAPEAAKASDTSLGTLRALKLQGATSDDKYAQQCRTASKGRTGSDEELTEDEVQLLIRAYGSRATDDPDTQSSEQDGPETHEELLGHEEVKW